MLAISTMSLSNQVKWLVLGALILASWWLPWWLFVTGLFIAIMILPRFYWSIIPALLFDLTYGIADVGSYRLVLPVSVITVILLILSHKVHQHLRV